MGLIFFYFVGSAGGVLLFWVSGLQISASRILQTHMKPFCGPRPASLWLSWLHYHSSCVGWLVRGAGQLQGRSSCKSCFYFLIIRPVRDVGTF